MARKVIAITIIVVAALSTALLAAYLFYRKSTSGPLRIGVLLPLSGPNDSGYKRVLDWARDDVNKRGGVGDRELELVYADTSSGDVKSHAARFLDDPSIDVVIGPATSEEVYAVAPEFIQEQKILLSPSATSGDIFKAFGRKGFFWRTARSDIAQIRTILYALRSKGAKRVSVVSEQSDYGETFFRWAGFFSNELGLDLSGPVQFARGSRDLSRVAREALRGDPEYTVCACFPEDAVLLEREFRRSGSTAKVIFTDAAMGRFLLDRLGSEGVGVAAVAPAADPRSRFDEAFRARFNEPPGGFAANIYDSFLLASYVLARQQVANGGFFNYVFGGGEPIDRSFKMVVSEKGTGYGWNEPEKVIDRILTGGSFDLNGASGPLDYDSEYGVDPLESFYSLERIEQAGGRSDFVTENTWSSNDSLGVGKLSTDASPARTTGSAALSEAGRVDSATARQYPQRKGLWAVIVATSSGWENYRHQADALSLYQLLKKNGVPDERIILFLVNDLADDPRNPEKGNVHSRVGGPNLLAGAKIDYSGADVRPGKVLDVLQGRKSAATPVVLESDTSSDVLLFMIGHGRTGQIEFGKGGELSAGELAGAVDGMNRSGRYRRLFIIADSCFGESLGAGITSPGALFFSGAEGNEGCFGTNYDPALGTWLSDEFAGVLISALATRPGASLADLYADTYRQTAGSHPTMLNYRSFGPLDKVSSGEFVTP